MKIIIVVAFCYLLIRFIKPKWKAFLLGIFGYILISFIGITMYTSNTHLNITGSSFSYFVAGALGEFIAYFAIGLVVSFIFNKSKKEDGKIIENPTSNNIMEDPNSTNDNPPLKF